MSVREFILQRIREEIKFSGLSRKDLALDLNVSQYTISEYIRGKSLPALDTFFNLCMVLDIDANDILCVAEYRKQFK